ncbi:hypothetical protein L208DRAFT_1270974, partial [Tricholoma matsutake]
DHCRINYYQHLGPMVLGDLNQVKCVVRCIRDCNKWAIIDRSGSLVTVNPVGPVFHLFSLRNPDFIIYMAELRADEFGMTFQLHYSKHLRYEFHIQHISTFYAKLLE